MTTLLMSLTSEHIRKIENRDKTVRLCRRNPNLKENDLLIFYNRTRQTIDSYAFVERVITGTPAQVWKKVETTCCTTKNRFAKYFAGKKEAFGVGLKNVTSFKEPIRWEVVSEKVPDLSPPKDFVPISLSVFKERLCVEIKETPKQNYYLYLAEETRPEDNAVMRNATITNKRNRLCFLGISISHTLINQNIRYYYPSLELVCYVAFENKRSALEYYVKYIRNRFDYANIEGKWFELSLDETCEVIESFEKAHSQENIHFYFSK